MRYVSYTDAERRALRWEEKRNINRQIDRLMQEIGKPQLDIAFMTGDLTVLCYDKHRLAGFIHILPEDSFYEGTTRKEKTEGMYVDYIAVAPQYQRQHIATNLYLLSVLELQKMEAETLTAVLLDEYSRRAFEKTAETRNLDLTKTKVNCTETIQLTKE